MLILTLEIETGNLAVQSQDVKHCESSAKISLHYEYVLKQLCLNDFLKKKLYSLVENGLAGFCLFGFVVAFFFCTLWLTSVLFFFRMYENMSTMVYLKEEKLEKLTQDEIIAKTKQVINGLEALKNEHNSILQSLLETLKCLKKDDETNLVEEKSNMIRKSLEMLELGLSEAQVKLK